jgi:ribosome biogenesis GTPase
MINNGIVVKSLRGCFTVEAGDGRYECVPRGKTRGGGVYCGDRVDFCEKELVIERVRGRKNLFVRPPVANVGRVLIVTAIEPIPDLLLIDKMLVKCFKEKAEPVICMDKNDLPLAAEFFARLSENYSAAVEKIISVSAKTGCGIDKIAGLLSGEGIITCVAGQSAMGKSSVLNALLPLINAQVGGLSQKSGRGKHTTRHTEMFALPEGGYIADTPGFSLLDEEDVEAQQLKYYYPEFIELQNECRFYGCNHINEPGCAVIQNIGKAVSAERHARYIEFFKEVDKYQRNKYK